MEHGRRDASEGTAVCSQVPPPIVLRLPGQNAAPRTPFGYAPGTRYLGAIAAIRQSGLQQVFTMNLSRTGCAPLSGI